jgi:farnesyl-diphosphate farnesyltransferase
MDRALNDILKGVSRSFYLSIHVLPQAVRDPIALGYLLARAADTIADTEVLPPDYRLRLLARLRQAVAGGGTPDGDEALLMELMDHLPQPGRRQSMELRLLLRIHDCLALLRGCAAGDQELLRWVLDQLLSGMERDLRRFPAGPRPVPPGEVVALPTLEELDDYTYFAAGCVGEFWTRLCAAHLPVAHLLSDDLLRRGIHLGKALQLVNVIRDAPADLLAGRCYWPADLLRGSGLRPQDLAELVQPGAAPPDSRRREAVLGATSALCGMAEELIASAWLYVQAIPRGALRLRLSCSWPLHVAHDTVAAIRAAGSPLLRPGRPVKVKRRQVYGMLLRSTTAAALGRVGPNL